MPNHQDNFSTNLTSGTSASDTTSPLNSIPAATPPFYIAFDATNLNGHYEVKQITSKTATNVLHSALSYDHTTAETVSLIVPAEEMDALSTGWQVAPGTWTYASADAPTFTMTTSIDLSSFIPVGARIKLTQTTAKYFIVTAISGTTVTLYGGTDYTLANAAITSPYFSIMKCPVGFPLDPTKWTVTATDTSMRTQATPTQNTWYNPGTITASIPIGAWKLSYSANVDIDDASASTPQIRCTLSTANNSESDATMTAAAHVVLNAGTRQGMGLYREKFVVLAAKASHYLNVMTPTASVDNLNIRGDIGTTVIRAVCAYL